MTTPSSYLVLDYGGFDAMERAERRIAAQDTSERILESVMDRDESVGALLDVFMTLYLSIVEQNPGVAPIARMCLDAAARHLDVAADAGLQTWRLLDTLKTKPNHNPNGESNV